MDPVTLDLTSPVEWHAKMVTILVVKPPTTRLYLQLGEPRIYIRNSDGAYYTIEKDEVIRKYIDEMVQVDGGDMFVGNLSLLDGKRVKGAVLSFFDKADAIIFAPRSDSSPST